MQYHQFSPLCHHQSEAKIAQATHRGIIDELLSPAADPSSQQDDPEPGPLTKDVGIQCG